MNEAKTSKQISLVEQLRLVPKSARLTISKDEYYAIGELAHKAADALEIEERATSNALRERDALQLRADETPAILTNEQCQRVIANLADQEWSGISNDDVRLWAGFIDAVRSPEETSGQSLHDEKCGNCGEPWSKHLTNRLICPDAAIPDVYRFRQELPEKASDKQERNPATDDEIYGL